MNLPPERRAFTLLELLASVSIIVILASLLFPTVKTMQSSAKSTACLSNMRNMGSAFGLYAAENNGLLPALRFRTADANEASNPSKENWQFEINPYLEVNGVSFKQSVTSAGGRAVFCPEYLKEFKGSTDAQKLVSGGYGMNADLRSGLDHWDHRVSRAAVAKPASTILVGDSDDYHLNVKANTWTIGPDDKGRFVSGDPVRHGKTANYLFVDGHISALAQKTALAVLTGTENP